VKSELVWSSFHQNIGKHREAPPQVMRNADPVPFRKDRLREPAALIRTSKSVSAGFPVRRHIGGASCGDFEAFMCVKFIAYSPNSAAPKAAHAVTRIIDFLACLVRTIRCRDPALGSQMV